MKSTERLIDNLVNDDFRKCEIDIKHAVKNIMDKRVEQKKQEFIKRMNDK